MIVPSAHNAVGYYAGEGRSIRLIDRRRRDSKRFENPPPR